MDDSARLTEVEIKLTHQERLVETLNGVIIELRREHDQLCKRFDALERMLAARADDPVDEPPPHY